MNWKTAGLLGALLVSGVLAIAQGATAAGPDNKPSNPVVVKAVPKGHSPRPVQDIGRSDLFHGYRCGASDCLLHQQGYQWGSEHRVVNPRDCHGTSEEFLEGCLAFAGIEGPLGQREFDPSFPHMAGID